MPRPVGLDGDLDGVSSAVNRIALPIRFVMTWRILFSSPARRRRLSRTRRPRSGLFVGLTPAAAARGPAGAAGGPAMLARERDRGRRRRRPVVQRGIRRVLRHHSAAGSRSRRSALDGLAARSRGSMRSGRAPCASSAASCASGTRSTGCSSSGLDSSRRASCEQVLDEGAHADGLLLDAVHRLGDVLRALQRAHPVELGVAAHRDQRGAQLMARVADEAPHLLDGAGAVVERAVDPVQHRVERAVQPADLRVGVALPSRWPKSPSAIAAAVLLHLPQRARTSS